MIPPDFASGRADAPRVPDVLSRPDHLDAVDRGLVARCVDGDIAALRSLFERHATTVMGCAEVAARRVGAPDADTLVSGAFVALWDDAETVLNAVRSVEAALLVAVARLGLGRSAFG